MTVILVKQFPGCRDGEVSLIGGSRRHEGRVEICINETWGTVCDNTFNESDAKVVCLQLGLTLTVSSIHIANSCIQNASP